MIDKATILGIVEANPGATGHDVYQELFKRSRARRWFGEDSFLAKLFGPSLVATSVKLCDLEEEGHLTSYWGSRRPVRRWRQKHYFARKTMHEQDEPI